MKVGKSYSSITGGVSEQIPHERREGQNYLQINMTSDPVRGVARRHGSVALDEKIVRAYDLTTWTALLAGTAKTKTFTFFVGAAEYDLVYRSEPDTYGLGTLGAFVLIRKADGKILDVVCEASTLVNQLVSGGVSAIVNVGKYLYIAGNSISTAYTGQDTWRAASNASKFAAWVRGSAYSRKYSVTLMRADGTKVVGTYTTKSSGYPGDLDTSDILVSDTEYQKKVNDRVNAYNSAVTAWITEAANDIATPHVAQKLADSLTAQGVTCSVVGSTVVIDNTGFTEISCDDSGDGTLIRGVGNEVAAAELVSSVHYAGKIVKVRPKRSTGEDAYYLQAIAKDGVSTGWTEVYWREAAGYVSTPTALFCMAAVKDNALHIAGSAAGLATMTGYDVPSYTASVAGDLLNSPIPTFFGRKIDYLGMFQDRLVVGAGPVLSMSRSGDYLNFFRASALTIEDTDPIEVYALGAEGDTIVSSVTFDRNVTLFGRQRQYMLNGRQTMTPGNALVVASTNYEDAIDSNPISSGNYVFYCNSRGVGDTVTTAAFQVQIGMVVDSPESYRVSGQLDSYLAGSPVEMAALTKPDMLFLRTSASRNGLYVYSYLDNPASASRDWDAWFKWEWSPSVGYQIGMSRYMGDLYVYMVKEGMDSSGNRKIWYSVERFSARVDLSAKPYLDSLRLANSLAGFVNPSSSFNSELYVAFGNVGTAPFIGDTFDNRVSFFGRYPTAPTTAYVGVSYPAYFEPTQPYMRDSEGKAILSGRLTVTKYLVSVKDTGGMTVSTVTSKGPSVVRKFNGKVVGGISTIIGQQPIVSAQISAFIGKETREHSYYIEAVKWLPLTVTGIEWVGQFFNNVRRG